MDCTGVRVGGGTIGLLIVSYNSRRGITRIGRSFPLVQSSRLIALLNQQRAVVYVGLATFLFTLAQGVSIYAYPRYGRAELDLTLAQVGLTVSAFAVARVFTNVPAAMISNLVGRRWILIAGGLFAATGYILSATADSLIPLMVYRFIVGIGSAAFITVGIATTADLSSPANRARLMSVFQWSFILGITIGPFVGGFIAQFWGLRIPFYVISVVSVTSALWTLAMVPETRGRQQPNGQVPETVPSQPPTHAGQPARQSGFRQFSFMLSRGYLLVMLIFIGAFFIRGGGLFNLFPDIAAEDLGLSEGWIGFMVTLPAIASLLILPFVGTISDRYGRKTIIVPGMFLYILCLAIMGYSAPVLILSAAVVFGIGVFIFGIAQGMEGPVPIAYIADVSPTERQATAQGMARTIGDIALMSGGPVLGLLSDSFSNASALYSTAVAMSIFMFIFWVFARETAGRRVRRA